MSAGRISGYHIVAGCWWRVAVESIRMEVPMTCLRFFLPGLFALSAFGQSPQNAVDPSRITKEAVQTILGNNLGQTKPRPTGQGMNYLAPLSVNIPREASCSVALIEMEIPKGVNFLIEQVHPSNGTSDNMPVAKGLPACSTGTGR